MFDRIAPRYDLLNRVLSMRRDVAWRRRLARHLPDAPGLRVLDLATGTGDVLLALHNSCPDMAFGLGVDVAGNMLALARDKIAGRGLDHGLAVMQCDALCLALPDGIFDAVTIAFGIRNVPGPEEALREIHRVLRPGGRVLVLEFSLPRNRPFRALYLAYFRHVLPHIGGLLSGDFEAYRYLNRTAERFPRGGAFCALLEGAGFGAVHAHPLTFGIATLYQGDK